MSKVWPWHSVEVNAAKVHHTNSACAEGKRIDSQFRREGTGGHPVCKNCERLDRHSSAPVVRRPRRSVKE